MPQRRTLRIVLGSVLITTVMGCGGGGGQAASPVTVRGTTAPATTGGAGLGDPSLCPIGALANASDPVDITVWSSETGVNLDAVTALVDEYNATQTDVHVDLVAQGAESDLAFLAALRSGRLPDLLRRRRRKEGGESDHHHFGSQVRRSQGRHRRRGQERRRG